MNRQYHRVPLSACPVCAAELSGATNLTGEGAPEPGNLTMCLTCSCPLVFMNGLRLRRLTAADYMALPEEGRRAVERMYRLTALYQSERATKQ